MSPSLPNSAARLLDFIASFEAPRGYDTIFRNQQTSLPRSITSMSLDEILAQQPHWSARFGSSATGRYQFMRTTLEGLKTELGLGGGEIFTPDLQDRLAYRLLIRRGFPLFIAARLSLEAFALNLAKEWASLPVLRPTLGAHGPITRGQSFYAGDPRNRSLVAPERVELVLHEVNAGARQEASPVVKPETEVAPATTSITKGTSTMTPAAGAKPWYLSKSIIGGLIAIALPILSVFFQPARFANPVDVTDLVMKIIEVAGPIVGGLLAVYGRVKATQPIKGTDAERDAETFLGGGSPQLDLGAALAPALQGLIAQIGQTVQQGVAEGLRGKAPVGP